MRSLGLATCVVIVLLFLLSVSATVALGLTINSTTYLSIPAWMLRNVSKGNVILYWGVTGSPNLTVDSMRRFWYVDEAGGGYQPKGAFGILMSDVTVGTSRIGLLGVYGYVVNITLLHVSPSEVYLVASRDIPRVLYFIERGWLPQPHETWLRYNTTVIVLKVPTGLAVSRIEYSLDGSTWIDVSSRRVAEMYLVDNVTNSTPAWYFSPADGLLMVRLPLNTSSGDVWLRVYLAQESASAEVSPSSTVLYIGDMFSVKVTVTSTTITATPLWVTVACYDTGGHLAFQNHTLLNYPTGQRTVTVRLRALAPPGTYTCYVWVETAQVGTFTISIRSYTDKLYWTQPTGTFYAQAGNAYLFHIYDLYFTGKNTYSNVTVYLNKSIPLLPGRGIDLNKFTYVVWDLIPRPIGYKEVKAAYDWQWNYWGKMYLRSNLLNYPPGHWAWYSLDIVYQYSSIENKYLPAGFIMSVGGIWISSGNIGTINVAVGVLGTATIVGIGNENSYSNGTLGLIYSYFKTLTGQWYNIYKEHTYVPTILQPTLSIHKVMFTLKKAYLGVGQGYWCVYYSGVLGAASIIRGMYTPSEAEAVAKYHVVPWGEVVFLVDPSMFLWSNRTIPLVSARGFGGYARVGSGVYVLPARMYYVYVFVGYAHDEHAHLLVPPGVCIRVWNETWSMTFCNLQNVLPFLDVPLSPGQYHWALGEAVPVDFVFIPESLTYGTSAVPVISVTSLLYPDADVGTVPNITLTNSTELSIVTYAWDRATSLLAQTPITDLSKIRKLSLVLYFKVNKYVDTHSSEVPILIVERSGQTLTNYAVRIVLNSTNFHAWNNLTCNSAWSPTSCNFWFTDTEGHPLYYWVEYFNKTEQKAIIWVKVPKIPANGTTVILMHWATTNPYNNYLNPKNVFIFFDTFTTFEDWNNWGSGKVIWNSTFGYDNLGGSIEKIAECDPNGGYKSLGTAVSVSNRLGIVIEAYDYRPVFTGCSCDRWGLEDNNFNGFTVRFCYTNDFGIDIRKGGSYVGSVASTSASYTYKEWLFARLIIFADRVEAQLYKVDPSTGTYTLLASISGPNSPHYTTFNYVTIRGGYPYILDVIKVYYIADPPPAVFVNVSFVEVDVGFTSSGSPSSSSPRLVVGVRAGAVSPVAFLVLGSSWRSTPAPVQSGEWCRLNVTWVEPSSSGNVTVSLTCGAYSIELSGTYVMGGGLYLWLGLGSSLSLANVTIGNITLVYSDVLGNTYRFVLHPGEGLREAVWSLGQSRSIIINVFALTYSPNIVIMGNASGYRIVKWISESTLSTVTELRPVPTCFGYGGVLSAVWVFGSEEGFPVNPGLAYVTNITQLPCMFTVSRITVLDPEDRYRTVLVFGMYSGSLYLRAVTSAGTYSYVLFTPGTVINGTGNSGREVFVSYSTEETPFLLLVHASEPISNVTLSTVGGSLQVESLGARVGYGSSIIAYVPAAIGVINLTTNSLVDAYDVKVLAVGLRSPVTFKMLGQYLLHDINVIFAPAPGIDILEINGTFYLDLAVLAEVTVDSVPMLKNLPTTSINIYVTVPEKYSSFWKQPFYLLVLYDTGTFSTVIGTSYGYGTISSQPNMLLYQFSVDVPDAVLGSTVTVVVESPKTGMIEVFPFVKLVAGQGIYLMITKVPQGGIVHKYPIVGNVRPPNVAPSSNIIPVPTATGLLALTTREQTIVAVFVGIALFALFFTRSRDAAKALLMTGIGLTVIGVAFLFGRGWVIFVIGVVLTALSAGWMLARRWSPW